MIGWQREDGDFIWAARFWEIADSVLVEPDVFGIGEMVRAQPGLNYRRITRDAATGDVTISRDDMERTLDSRVVYVCANLLEVFATAILPRFTRPFVLISGTTDENIGDAKRELADHRLVEHWFAQNVNIKHPKITPIPIGLANPIWPHGNIADLQLAQATAVDVAPLCYLNFKLTNLSIRTEVGRLFIGRPFVKVSGSKPYIEYLLDMKSCRFCISPPGAGIDCHRTWESLYVGSIPVVQDGPWLEGLRDLPLLAVTEWSHIDLATLQDRAASMPRDPAALGKLRFSWWRAAVDARR